MSTIYNDFRPETRSLIARLKKAGFAIEGGNNGDENFAAVPFRNFVEELVAADDSWLFISRDGFRFSLYLVLGNSPGELVSDYRYARAAEATEAFDALEAACDAHYSAWEERKQPTRTV